MPSPELLSEMRKLLKEDARADPFEILDDLRDVLSWAEAHKHVHAIDRHLSRNHVEFVLHCDLAQDVPRPDRNLPCQNALSVFRDPYEVHLQIETGMGAGLVTSHGDMLYPRFA